MSDDVVGRLARPSLLGRLFGAGRQPLRLVAVPRYRQKVRHVPGELARPVWVDDADFDVAFHVRRSALPRPGTCVQLTELVARLMSRPLDPDRLIDVRPARLLDAVLKMRPAQRHLVQAHRVRLGPRRHGLHDVVIRRIVRPRPRGNGAHQQRKRKRSDEPYPRPGGADH